MAGGWRAPPRSWRLQRSCSRARFERPVVPEPSNPGARGADTVPPPESYEIEASFYRKSRAGEERLGSDSRLRLNDQIYLSVQTSIATYLYVVNEDEKGEAFLLFPHADAKLTNPVAANRQVRLPSEQDWQVDSVGGKEHFIVFASKGRSRPSKRRSRICLHQSSNPARAANDFPRRLSTVFAASAGWRPGAA